MLFEEKDKGEFMSILSRYIVKNHTYFLMMTLGIGIGIFIVIDLIERSDTFFAFEGGGAFIIPFYLAKMPGIISQILPAVFLLASVVLLCVMIAARESIALQAGGISMFVLAKVLMYCGFFWAIFQFICSLLVGYGEDIALDIWRNDARRDTIFIEANLENVWFTENNYVIHIGKLFKSGKGDTFTAYELSDDEKKINTIIRAESVVAKKGEWLLTNVQITHPDSFENKVVPLASLPINQSALFFFLGKQNDPQSLDFFVLGEAIERLEYAGSNVEDLKTIWYGKIAYSASIIVLAFVSVAIVTYKDNIYLAVMIAVVVAFLAYVFTIIGDSLGQGGAVPPIVGAWGPQIILFLLALMRIQYVFIRR